MTAESASDYFRDWLEAMHPRLSRFEDFLLPKYIIREDGAREEFLRDYSRESLNQLEQYMLDRWPTYEDFEADNDTDFIDGAVRYIGETLLRACGGGWHYTDDPEFIFSGRPYVKLDTLDGTPGSPFNLITALLHRRTGGELTKVFDAQVRRIEKRRTQEGPGWEPHRDPVPGMTL